MKFPAMIAAICAIVCTGSSATAQSSQPIAPAAKSGGSVTVAVLDFESSAPGLPDLGRDVADAVSATLSGQPNVALVERAALGRLLAEHELNLIGIVETAQAIRIGKLVGARILVMGRASRIGDSIMLTAKLVGTETSRVEVVKQDGESNAELGGLVVKLADQVARTLREKADQLLPAEDRSGDALSAARAALRDRRRPVVAVLVREEHLSTRPAVPPDPAVETEIKSLLRESGFTVRDVPGNPLVEWAGSLRTGKPGVWPRELEGVDVVIVGEAFSELGARIGQLASCSARAELNLIQRSKGEIELADRTTARGVDLAEHVAGKTALEKCGQTLGLRILQHFARTLPAK